MRFKGTSALVQNTDNSAEHLDCMIYCMILVYRIQIYSLFMISTYIMESRHTLKHAFVFARHLIIAQGHTLIGIQLPTLATHVSE